MSARRDPVFLLPREHGTYGEVLFPLLTAFGVAGPSGVGAAVALAAIAGYAAHESFAVLVGLRGPRARRDLGPLARRTLIVLGGTSLAAAAVGTMLGSPACRYCVGAALVLSLGVVGLARAGHERTAHGEVGVGVALSAWSVPVALAGGASWTVALTCAAIWSVVFASGTLGVRAVIARTRRERVATPAVACALISVGALGVNAWLVTRGVLPVGTLWALAPGIFVALGVCLPGVTAHHLRRIGWTLVSASAITLAALVTSFR